MVDLLGSIPLSVAGVVALLVSALVAFIALVLADKIIAHSIEPKKLLIISLVALFITPIAGALVLSYASAPGLVSAYALPLVVWIVLGEFLLGSERKTRLKVAAAGYVLYLVLSAFVAPYIFALLPF